MVVVVVTDTFNEEMSVHNDSGEWIIGNIGQFGYYRVNYDLVNWNRLLYQLKSNHTVLLHYPLV